MKFAQRFALLISIIQYRIIKIIIQIPTLYRHQLGVPPIFAKPKGMSNHPEINRRIASAVLHKYFSLVELAMLFSRKILEVVVDTRDDQGLFLEGENW